MSTLYVLNVPYHIWIIMFICTLLFVFILSVVPVGCAERKRSSDSWMKEEFDFYKHRQAFAGEITVDGIPQGFPIKSQVVFRPDHQYATLHDAAQADDPKGIELLLTREEHKKYLNGFDGDGQTPLQRAIDYGCHNAISFLIQNGALVDAYNREHEYNAWTLAKAYFDAKIEMNVVPFQIIEEALAQKGELEKYLQEDKRKHKKDKKAPVSRPASMPAPPEPPARIADEKPSRKVYLRRRSARSELDEVLPMPKEDPPTPPYEEYLLNV